MIKYTKTLAVMASPVLLLFFIFSCGKGEYAGFNAPAGSTVALSTSSTSVPVTAGTTVSALMTVSVLGPTYGESGSTTGPLNNIQVVLTCFNCTIWDKTNGAEIILGDTPLERKNSPYVIQTNSQGFYQFMAVVGSPADIGLTTYKAIVSASIGRTSTTSNIDIVLP